MIQRRDEPTLATVIVTFGGLPNSDAEKLLMQGKAPIGGCGVAWSYWPNSRGLTLRGPVDGVAEAIAILFPQKKGR
jgi:hypothetical protein